MAQRTGAERFLAPLAKAASAGGILALAAAAALALPGCGGGSSEAQTTSATSSAAAPGAKEAPSSAPGKAPSPAEEEQAKAAAEVRAKAAAEGTPSQKGKHGPKIAAPTGEPEPEATPQQKAQSTVANIALSSPALQATGGSTQALPATYTCEGKDSWPQLDWQGVPAGTAELALFAMNIQPVNEQIFFDWAVGGLDPGLSGIQAGQLPKGAVSGKNSFGKAGYSICPPQGAAETYMFVLYALPKALGPKQGFDPLALREEALRQSGNAGLLAASYSRG